MQRFPAGGNYVLFTLFAYLIAISAPVGAATFIGSNVDSRMMIGFKVPDVQVQSRLPEGWTSIAFPAGPLKGANLLMGLEERLFAADAEGKPLPLPTSRAVAMLGLARQTGGKEVRLYVLRLFTSDPNYDPFKNAVVARVSRKSAVEGRENVGRTHREEWAVDLGDGGKLSVAAAFTTSRGTWVSDKARPYSNTDPSVSRLFTYDQLVELAMSAPAKKPLVGDLSVSTSIPGLTGLFDGSQQLIAVMNIPAYVRKVFMP